MTVLAFVALLAIPVLMLAKRTPAMVFLVAVWGLFLGMTGPGQLAADMLNDLGTAALAALRGVNA